MNRRQRIIVSVTGIFIVLLILIGLTYGYYLTRITGNGNPTSISVTTANLELVYGDGTTNILTSSKPIEPGKFTSSKDFTVTNNGNVLTDYAVTLEDFAITYANDTVIDGQTVKAGTVTKMEYPSDMKMEITCVVESDDEERNGTACGTVNSTLPTENSILLTNSIEVDDVHKYVLTLTYLETGKDQSADMNKTIRGKIDIIDPKSTIDIEGSVATYQTGDYVEINSTPIKSEIVDGKYKIIGVEPGSHTLNIKYKDANGDIQTRGSQSLTIKKGEETSVIDNTITFTDSSRIATVDVTESYGIEISDIVDFYDTFVKSIAHRGYSLIAPENTIVAFELAKQQGFNYVETDVRFTSDGIPVLMHEESINLVARNKDGSTLNETINISDITYRETLNYDFGIYKGSKYAGTKIATFEEFIVFCKNNNLKPYIEIKNTITESQIRELIDIVKQYKMEKNTTYISNLWAIGKVKDYDDKARIGAIVNSIDSDLITSIKNLMTGKNKVFINVDKSSIFDNNQIQLCKDANIPLETHVIDVTTLIENLDPYISGVTSNYLISGKIKYELLLNKRPYLSEYQVVKVLNSSDITYKVTPSENKPYYYASNVRATYVNFDIALEEGYIYKFEFESPVETAKMGIHLIDDTNLAKANLGEKIHYMDLGWQSSGYTKQISYSTDGGSYKAVRLVFCMIPDNWTTPVEDGFIESVKISRKSA